jgi:Fe-Mn family superoxide dismutase
MGHYVLPELTYAYKSLEPHISGAIMELHHGKHHAAYVKNANAAVAELEVARQGKDMTRIVALEEALAFHLSGHVLHSIFWKNLCPSPTSSQPNGALARDIDAHFGGFDGFRRQMTAVAATVTGSGWAALMWEPIGKRLLITQIHDHQSNLSQGGVPLMVLDAWEHAYYLQYQNRKEEFFEAIWKVWSWDDIARRHEAARSLDLDLSRSASP